MNGALPPATMPSQASASIAGTSTATFAWSWDGQPVAVGYDTRGDGREGRGTVVLLPAFSTVSTRDEMRALAERLAPDLRTVAPDWPGFGEGRHPKLRHGPDLQLAFLRAFVEQVATGPASGPVMVVAAGHAAGYALALAQAKPGVWSRIALVAPTWRGPLPTMMGGYRPLQDRVRAALRLPGLGHALYRLNVAKPVIAAMYREHVYADRARVTPAFVAAKAGIARRRGGRFGSAAFVTGALDPVRGRDAFLRLADPPPAPTMLLYGAGTPPKSLAEIEALARVPGITARRLDRGALGLHEEAPEQVAALIRPFLLAEG
jgi:pimeloyl-ACP methyl ester carboxylesterase